jgi:tetratricopeptide (TPR) repeat protein
MALARHEPRAAALQYTAAAADGNDAGILARATQVSAETLQPTLALKNATRWSQVDPTSVDAQRAAAQAALALHRINEAAGHYRTVLSASPLGADAEFAALETELGGNDNIFGSRQLADRLAASVPSAAALRLQGFTSLRADDPAAAVRSFKAALVAPEPDARARDPAARRELLQALARAQIMSGDAEPPLAEARATVERENTPTNRLDYALLLMTAQRDAAASQQLEMLTKTPEYAAPALRLLGLIEYQQGHFDSASTRFADLLRANKYLDDAFFYLGVIADRHDDPEQALRLYAQVQSGDNALPAMLRATTILQKHGAGETADELLDRLIEDEPQRAPEIVSARARIYADSNDLPRALTVLKEGLEEYPDSVDLRYAMATTYEEMGRNSAALKELKTLLDLRPDDPAAMNALGYTLADHSKELGKARALIERAHAEAPKNAAILDSLGWVLFRQGHTAQAEPYLREAYQEDRGGDIAAHLGEVLWQLGRHPDAERIWAEAAVIDGDNRVLKSTRQRLKGGAPQPDSVPPAAPAPPSAPPPPVPPPLHSQQPSSTVN